jgi:hypothetical protein
LFVQTRKQFQFFQKLIFYFLESHEDPAGSLEDPARPYEDPAGRHEDPNGSSEDPEGRPPVAKNGLF